jgi:hypothetical protein
MSTPPPLDFNQSDRPLDYAGFAAPRRPGILTAVGVISIVVGSLSALMSVSGIFSAVVFLTMSHMTFPAGPVVVNPATTNPAGPGPALVTTTTTQPNGVSTTVLTYHSTAYSTVSPFPFHISPGASILTITEDALSVCVAVLLIVAGSLALRDSLRAPSLHRLYVLFKIPLIVVAAFATWWTYTGMFSSLGTMAANNGPGPNPFAGSFVNVVAMVEAGIMSLFSLIYPVALLIVFSTRTVKAHYSGLANPAQ